AGLKQGIVVPGVAIGRAVHVVAHEVDLVDTGVARGGDLLEPAPVAHFCQNKFRRTEGRAHPAKQILVLRDVDVCFPVEIDSIIAIAVYKACNIRDKNCDEAGARAYCKLCKPRWRSEEHTSELQSRGH